MNWQSIILILEHVVLIFATVRCAQYLRVIYRTQGQQMVQAKILADLQTEMIEITGAKGRQASTDLAAEIMAQREEQRGD